MKDRTNDGCVRQRDWRSSSVWCSRALIAIAFLAVLGRCTSAQAQTTYTVDRSADDGSGTGNSGSLSYVLGLANGAANNNIVFTVSTVTLSATAPPPAIQQNMTINGSFGGGSVVIQANGVQGLTVDTGLTVSLSNLVINGAKVQGGTGGDGSGANTGGGGGGLGAGGGLNVATDNTGGTPASVTLSNVMFTNNNVTGGTGGNPGTGAGTGNGGAGGNFNSGTTAGTAKGNPGGTLYGGGGGAATTGNGNPSTYGGGGSGAGSSGATGGAGTSGGGGNGGAPGVGGNGGNGLGGGVFISNYNTVTFSGNSSVDNTNTATPGTPGAGGTLNNNGNGGGIYVGQSSKAIFDNATSQTYSGDIYNNGQVIIQGTAAGTITFLGNNANNTGNSNDTLINTGTLAGTTNGIQGKITANAGTDVNFNQNFAGTFHGSITGAGGVNLLGTGLIIFAQANTYTGGTTVSAGIIEGDTNAIQGAITNNSLVVFNSGANGTYAGPMTGTGGVIVANTGTTTFTGLNSYTGGTQVNSGTLAGTTTAIQGTITNSSNVTFTNAVDGTYAGNMSGAGSVTITASPGTNVTFSGTNAYTGGTTVSSGRLIGNTNAVQGAITNNSAVTFFNTTSGTYSGAMSGTGSVTIDGGSTVNFSGIDTYGGGTTVNIGSTLSGTTNGVQGAIVNAGNVTFNQNFDGIYSGNMSGIGSVDKAGTGAVTFSGTNTYAGPTEISAGTLQSTTLLPGSAIVDSGGTFGASGGVAGNVTNNGTLAQAGAITTMNIGGNLTEGGASDTVVRLTGTGQVAGTNNDLYSVTGTANLGGRVTISPSSGSFSPGNSYKFLTYGLTRNGTFTGVDSTSSLVGGTLVYNDVTKEVDVVLATTFVNATQTFNQQQVAMVLDANSATATGDFASVINQIASLDTSTARVAFQQLEGEVYGTTAQLMVQDMTYLYLMLRRSAAADGADAGPPPPPMLGAPGATPANGTNNSSVAPSAPALSANYDGPEKEIALVSYEEQTGEARIHFVKPDLYRWQGSVQGYGLGGMAISDGNASGGTYGMGGTLANMHRQVDCFNRLGMFVSYSNVYARAPGVLQTARANDGQVGTYWRHDNGKQFAMLAGSVGFDGYNATRDIQFGGINRTATGNFSGWQATSYGEFGFRVPTWRSWVLEPFLGMQYIYVRQNGFTESGADSLNLSVNDTNTHALRNLLGTRVMFADRFGWFRMRPGSRYKTELRATWIHEYLASETLLTARFAGAPTAAFGAQGLNFGRDWAVLGGGIGWDISARTRAFLNYDLQTNSQQTFHVGSGGITMAF